MNSLKNVWETPDGFKSLDKYILKGRMYYAAKILSIEHNRPRTRIVLINKNKKLVWFSVFTDDMGRSYIGSNEHVIVSADGSIRFTSYSPEEDGYTYTETGEDLVNKEHDICIEFGPMGVVDKARLMQAMFPDGEYRTLRVVKLDNGLYMCQCKVNSEQLKELESTLVDVVGARIYPAPYR